MRKDGDPQIDTDMIQTLALGLVDCHSKDQADRELHTCQCEMKITILGEQLN